jgi:hypothetical protein
MKLEEKLRNGSETGVKKAETLAHRKLGSCEYEKAKCVREYHSRQSSYPFLLPLSEA